MGVDAADTQSDDTQCTQNRWADRTGRIRKKKKNSGKIHRINDNSTTMMKEKIPRRRDRMSIGYIRTFVFKWALQSSYIFSNMRININQTIDVFLLLRSSSRLLCLALSIWILHPWYTPFRLFILFARATRAACVCVCGFAESGWLFIYQIMPTKMREKTWSFTSAGSRHLPAYRISFFFAFICARGFSDYLYFLCIHRQAGIPLFFSGEREKMVSSSIRSLSLARLYAKRPAILITLTWTSKGTIKRGSRQPRWGSMFFSFRFSCV